MIFFKVPLNQSLHTKFQTESFVLMRLFEWGFLSVFFFFFTNKLDDIFVIRVFSIYFSGASQRGYAVFHVGHVEL